MPLILYLLHRFKNEIIDLKLLRIQSYKKLTTSLKKLRPKKASLMHHEFSCELICTFLSPFELLRFRTLSSFHNSCTVKYLKRYFGGKTDLQNFVCPCCGGWLPQEDFLTGYSGFYNIFDAEMEEEIYEYITTALEDRGRGEVSRKALLCEQCELTETEIPYKTRGYVEMSVNHNRHLHKFFRFKGDRNYKTIFHNEFEQWAVVYQQVEDEEIFWNEYRCIQAPYLIKNFNRNLS